MSSPLLPFWVFLRSRPGRHLLIATLLGVAVTLALPWTPVAALMGFRPMPWSFVAALGGIVTVYIAAAEWAKRIFYQRQHA